MLTDSYSRPLLGARISLNYSDYCNFACTFCHKEGNPLTHDAMTESQIERAHTHQIHEKTLMTAEEVIRVSSVLSRMGVERYKLTGGEPMLRPDIIEIVEGIARLAPKDLGMTTNATRVYALAEKLKAAGLMRINISLHSLRKERFTNITGVNRLSEVLRAVERCVEVGLTPVKLNWVLLKDVNSDELDDFLEYAAGYNGAVELQLIELVREGSAERDGYFERNFFPLSRIEQTISQTAIKKTVRALQKRPRYLMPNGVWVELVRPYHNSEFCANNDRIRITPDGKFKPCLMREDNLVDFLIPMRQGATDEEIARRVFLANELREPYYKRACPVITLKGGEK